jgi:hypothetical protein
MGGARDHLERGERRVGRPRPAVSATRANPVPAGADQEVQVGAGLCAHEGVNIQAFPPACERASVRVAERLVAGIASEARRATALSRADLKFLLTEMG